MQPTKLRRAAAALMAATGIVHLALAPEYLAEKAYVGVLFIAGAAASAFVAARLWKRHDTLAWGVGGLTAAGMAAGFLVSRTVGLPGFHPSDWELSGILTVLLEAGFLAALALVATRPRALSRA